MAGVLGAAVGDPAFEKDHGGSRRFSDSTFAKADAKEREEDDYRDLVQSAMENTPSVSGGQASATGASRTENGNGNGVGGSGRMTLLERALETRDPDNERLLAKIRQRLDRVGIPLKTVVVRFEDLYIEADVRVGKRALPTLINSVRNVVEDILGNLRILPRPKVKLPILQNISGILKPGRMTLLLGPPSSGKSVLLRALAGKSDPGLRIDGTVTYNGHTFKEFYVQRTAAYVDQVDNHIGEMSVRETIDFAGRCQGAVFNNDVLSEMQRKEKEMGIEPDPDIDDFLMAAAAKSDMHNVMTDYVIKILGLDVCAETVVGNEMLRGISGGQKKRVTTAEMIVGPKRALFMDEISTGLDSSTTFQITTCLRNFTHHMDGTVLIALLQPAPETYDLFDDVMLLAEGHIVYHGPRERVLEFFSSIGFCCPDRKGVADFLQEVTSRKDQAVRISCLHPHTFHNPKSVRILTRAFNQDI